MPLVWLMARRCFQMKNPIFQDVPVLTMRDGLCSTRLKLIHPQSGRLLTWSVWAAGLALTSAALAGSTVGARYTTWFGAYTSSRWNTASRSSHGQLAHSRRAAAEGSPEEILLNGNELSKGHDFFEIGDIAISPNSKLMAWAEDTVSVLRMIDAKLVLLGAPFDALAPVLTERAIPFRRLDSLDAGGDGAWRHAAGMLAPVTEAEYGEHLRARCTPLITGVGPVEAGVAALRHLGPVPGPGSPVALAQRAK